MEGLHLSPHLNEVSRKWIWSPAGKARLNVLPMGLLASLFGLRVWSKLCAYVFMLPSKLNAMPGGGQ